jgi:hypothetical protein
MTSVVEWELEQEEMIARLATLKGWSKDGPEVGERRKHLQEEVKWRQKAALKALKKSASTASSPARAPRMPGVKAEGGSRSEPLKWLPSSLLAEDCETAAIIKFTEPATFVAARNAYPNGPWHGDRR